MMDVRRMAGHVVARFLRLPDGVLAKAFQPAPEPIDGFELDTQIRALLKMKERAGLPDVCDMGAQQAREDFRDRSGPFMAKNRVLESVEDLLARGEDHDVPLRMYTPKGLPARAPLLVFYHGGGWVIGDLETHDRICRVLADEARCKVVSVDYRLAPEHPFPAAPNDAKHAYKWCVDNAELLGVDRKRIAVGGDSAGGNLAAVVAQQAQALGWAMPCLQLLIYPSTDLTRSMQSHRTFADGYILTARTMEWFRDNYLAEHDRKDPLASPLFSDSLEGQPPAIVVTAGYDPLRDEGDAYAKALREAGVDVVYRCHGGLVHGFAALTGVVRSANQALLEMAADLRLGLATPFSLIS